MKYIKARIITIGDEILFGQITDTNSQWIADQLTQIGIKVESTLSIADTAEAIESAVEESFGLADIIIMTGGLGPTKDDVTKNTLTQFFGDTLEINLVAEKHVESFFTKRGLPFTDINRLQAALPTKAEYVHNEGGTAPGMWFNYNGKVLVSMAGVPSEMKGIMLNEVLPRIKERFETPTITHQFIKTMGIGESFLSAKIANWEDSLPENMKLAYLPTLAEVKLRLTVFGDTTGLDQKVYEVLPLISEYVYSLEDIELEEVVGKLLLEQNSTLSTAESCTGGQIAHLITRIAGSSAYFLGSVVSYANSVKEEVLKVKPETLSNFGAVSEQTVIEMAEGVLKLTGSSYAVSTSGIAGPGGGTPEKPVGTIWIAATNGDKTITKKLTLGRSREQNILYTSKAALNTLRLLISTK